MNSPKPQNFKERILAQIDERKVTMRPRVYFTLQLVLLGVLAFAVLIVSIFLVNFISFSVRISAHDALFGFGTPGFLIFVRTFPWELLLLDAVLIAALLKLLMKFKFGYRSPVLYILGALLVITTALGLAFDRGTGFNDDISERAHRNELPRPVGSVYQYAHRLPPPGSRTCACTITGIEGNTLTAFDREDDDKTPLTIIVPEDNPLLSTLKIGQTVLVVGNYASGTMQTFGLRKLPPRK